MDAVEFLKESERMCKSHTNCFDCPAFSRLKEECGIVDIFNVENKEQVVSFVEKWSKEHPPKTRQSEFLKMFPNARVEYGVIFMCPKEIDRTLNCKIDGTCGDCKKEYWLANV